MAVGVDHLGHLDLEAWRRAVRAGECAVACLQVADHEVGTLQPYAEAAEVCAAAGVPLVLDATAALGRINLAGEIGLVCPGRLRRCVRRSTSVGLLALRRSARWRAPYPVDDYQDGRWPGPPDVPAIFAAAVALESGLGDAEAVGRRQFALVDRLRREIVDRVPDVDVAGDPDGRVPHLLTFSALYVDGETLTVELDRAGFGVASGSACSANSETRRTC